MRSLVALDVTPSHNFLDLLNKIWDENDAVLPIDQRLPQSAKKRLVNDLGASWIISTDGEKKKLENGFQIDLVTEFFECVYRHPYVLSVYKGFGDIIRQKVAEFKVLAANFALHDALAQVESIL